jgi:hypothetical protein
MLIDILQPTFRTALSCDILEPLSAVSGDLSGDLPGDTMSNRLSALLYLVILLPTIRSTDFPLCPVWRYTTPDYPMWSTLSVDSTADYLICRLSALICMAILQMTICCTILCVAILQPTICGALIRLASLQLTTRSALPVNFTTDDPLYRLSAMLEFCPFSLAFGSISSSYMAWASNKLDLDRSRYSSNRFE